MVSLEFFVMNLDFFVMNLDFFLARTCGYCKCEGLDFSSWEPLQTQAPHCETDMSSQVVSTCASSTGRVRAFHKLNTVYGMLSHVSLSYGILRDALCDESYHMNCHEQICCVYLLFETLCYCNQFVDAVGTFQRNSVNTHDSSSPPHANAFRTL